MQMAPGQARTLRLPGGILITVIALDGTASVDLLRKAAYEADLYALFGTTHSEPSPVTGQRTPTGPGFYVGMSAALVRSVRAGVSLQRWSTQRGRLDPTLAILIRRPARPLHVDLV